MSTQHILPLETQMCRTTRRLGVVDPLHSYSDYKPDNEGRASGELPSSSTSSSSSSSLICRPPHNRPMTGAPTDHKSTESIACAHGLKIADDRGFIMSLRHPPVDPRKTRRYCTDFGLNDSCIPAPPLPQPLKPDHSLSSSVPSIFSTPLADVEGTESDSSSEDTDYDFPKPPPIGAALRRMQSSPQFTLEETAAVRELLKSHRDCAKSFQGERIFCPLVGLDAQDTYQTRNLIPPKLHGANLTQSQSEGVVRKHPLGGTPLAPHRTQENCLATREDISLQKTIGSSTPPRCPYTIRKVASMRQPLKRSDAPLIARQSILKTKSMKFEHKAEDPLERLQHSMEKLKSYAPQQRRWSITHNQGPQLMKMCDPLAVSNAGQRIPPAKDKGQRLSTPLIVQNLPASALDHTLGNPRMDHRLAPPFSHRSMYSQPVVRVSTSQDQTKVPKSFIDITPERKSKRESARGERARKLLSRASTSILGWGKALTGKS